jgi:polar amino acid transport system substrate-binding protein
MQPTGIEYDVAALAAKAMGVKLEIVQVTAPGRIPVLVNGQADMMLGGFAIVATRALQVWFTIPFASGKTGVIAPASTRINTLEDLAGMKVGVVRGSTQDVTITDMAPKTANIVRFDDDAASIAALISGQVDATVAGAIVAKATRAKNPDKRIELKVTLRENPLGIGVQRGNIDLLLWLNTFIFNLKYDGTLAALHKKYDIDYGLPIF